jgi:N-methylhydantoinase A
VTDADLLLGYLNPENFLGGEMKLDVEGASRAMARLAGELKVEPLDAAWGICNLVNENMASAARIHIAENGLDPRDFTMIATGGAGPVHAVEVARKLRIPRVLVPIAAGAGSCLGMLAAPARVDKAWSHPQLLVDVDWQAAAANLAALRLQSQVDLEAAGAADVEWMIGFDMRYAGQGAEIAVTIPYEEVSGATAARLLQAFESEYERLYGRLVPDAAPQVITWRLVGRASTEGHHFEWGDNRVSGHKAGDGPASTGRRKIYLPLMRRYEMVNVYDRYSLDAGVTLAGPLVLEERESTIVMAVSGDVTIRPDLTVQVTIKEFD